MRVALVEIRGGISGRMARRLVRDQDARRATLPLEELAQQALRRPLVAPALDEDVGHEAVLVDRPPRPVLLAGDRELDLIEVPLSKCHSSPGPGSLRRISSAKPRPNSSTHCRRVSWLTAMPRAVG